MIGLLSRPDPTVTVWAYRPIVRRLRAAGWAHSIVEFSACVDHRWARGEDRVIVTDVGNLIIDPGDGPEWSMPVVSPSQVAQVLEAAGVIEPVPQTPVFTVTFTADDLEQVKARIIEAIRSRRVTVMSEYDRCELYPQPGHEAPPLPPHADGWPVGAAALEAGETEAGEVIARSNWVDLPTDRALRAFQNFNSGGAEDLDAMYAEAIAQRESEDGAPC